MNPKLKTALLLAGLGLIAIGIFKPDFSAFNNPVSPNSIVELDLQEPQSEKIKECAQDVIKALAVDSDRKTDGMRLAQLYNDLATLISLDGDDQVVKNTDEVRQANMLTGVMLKLDLKGKYPELAEATNNLVKQSIGDDSILLSKDLRIQASQAFKALSWACYKGSK